MPNKLLCFRLETGGICDLQLHPRPAKKNSHRFRILQQFQTTCQTLNAKVSAELSYRNKCKQNKTQRQQNWFHMNQLIVTADLQTKFLIKYFRFRSQADNSSTPTGEMSSLNLLFGTFTNTCTSVWSPKSSGKITWTRLIRLLSRFELCCLFGPLIKL